MTQLDYRPKTPRPPHSVPGIISFACSLAPIVTLPYALRAGDPDALGMAIATAAYLLAPIGAIVLGFIGMLTRSRRPLFAILGFVFGAVELLLAVAIILAYAHGD